MKGAALAVLLASLFAPNAGASRIAGAPTDFKDYVPTFDAVFIGHVDTVSIVKWPDDTPCARGLGPFDAIRWIVRVEETLQGSGLHQSEVVFGSTGMSGYQAKPGQRVLAFGNRACSSNWQLWGYAFSLEGDTVLTDCSYFDNSERLSIRHPWDSLWNLLRPLRDRPHANTASVFDGFDGLGLFVATARLGGDRNTFEVSGRWIGSIVGPAPADTVRLRFHPMPGWGAPISPGDTLVVPWTGTAPARTLTFEVSPRAFQVENGVATMFGRPLEAIPATIVRRDERYRIPPIVYP